MMTTITGKLFNADGTVANGTACVSWVAFQTHSVTIVSGQKMIAIVEGEFTVDLYPNITAQPRGIYYTVRMELDSGAVYEEYWIVPDLPAATIEQVRSSFPLEPGMAINPNQIAGSGAEPGMILAWNGSYWEGSYVRVDNVSPNWIRMAVGSAGDDFWIDGSPVKLGQEVTIHIPSASASARGLVTTGTQTFAGAKSFTGAVDVAGLLTGFTITDIYSKLGSVESGAVPITRQVIAGTGLLGGGALSADVTLHANIPVIQTPWLQNVAGSGYNLLGAGEIEGKGVFRINSSPVNTGELQFWQAGFRRWRWIKDAGVEAGGNSGSDMLLQRYDDAGGIIGNAISISRNSGWVVLWQDVTVIGLLTANDASLKNINIPAGGRIQFGDNTTQNTAPVLPTRQIIAGAGMTGGGTLAADVTLNADMLTWNGRKGAVLLTKDDLTPLAVTSFNGRTGDVTFTGSDVVGAGGVPSTRQVIAGAGMTGGGPLSADVTLNANMLSVNGRTGAVVIGAADITAAGGVPATRSVLAGTGLAGGGALSADVTLTWPGTKVSQAGTLKGTRQQINFIAGVNIALSTVDTGSQIDLTISGTSGGAVPVPDTRQVIAGNGLLGGGPLTADVTLSANIPLIQTPWKQNIDAAQFRLNNASFVRSHFVDTDVDAGFCGNISYSSGTWKHSAAGCGFVLQAGSGVYSILYTSPSAAAGADVNFRHHVRFHDNGYTEFPLGALYVTAPANTAGPETRVGLVLDRLYGDIGDRMDIVWPTMARIGTIAWAAAEGALVFCAQAGGNDGAANEVMRMRGDGVVSIYRNNPSGIGPDLQLLMAGGTGAEQSRIGFVGGPNWRCAIRQSLDAGYAGVLEFFCGLSPDPNALTMPFRLTKDVVQTQVQLYVTGGSGTAWNTAPIQIYNALSRIAFHIPGMVSQLGLTSASDPTIRTFDNPGTGYENFKAKDITATGTMSSAGYPVIVGGGPNNRNGQRLTVASNSGDAGYLGAAFEIRELNYTNSNPPGTNISAAVYAPRIAFHYAYVGLSGIGYDPITGGVRTYAGDTNTYSHFQAANITAQGTMTATGAISGLTVNSTNNMHIAAGDTYAGVWLDRPGAGNACFMGLEGPTSPTLWRIFSAPLGRNVFSIELTTGITSIDDALAITNSSGNAGVSFRLDGYADWLHIMQKGPTGGIRFTSGNDVTRMEILADGNINMAVVNLLGNGSEGGEMRWGDVNSVMNWIADVDNVNTLRFRRGGQLLMGFTTGNQIQMFISGAYRNLSVDGGGFVKALPV